MKISIILSQDDIDTAIKDYLLKKGYIVIADLKYDSAPGRCLVEAELKVNKTKHPSKL